MVVNELMHVLTNQVLFAPAESGLCCWIHEGGIAISIDPKYTIAGCLQDQLVDRFGLLVHGF